MLLAGQVWIESNNRVFHEKGVGNAFFGNAIPGYFVFWRYSVTNLETIFTSSNLILSSHLEK